ncbi:uncharacterized protein LOC128958474 [Oppia nitens]|uniref:uncharacterized protein LOC128958474 n=1 Tax=Oppia nitens TaxID=1686743 RepID=UPI0023DACB78|nr:uncharacterized protein LOC128958474 [Oppia nitens]
MIAIKCCQSLLLLLSVLLLALNVWICLGDNNVTKVVVNQTNDQLIAQEEDVSDLSTVSMNETSVKHKKSNPIHRIQFTNGFLLRSLFVITVISMSLTLLCIIRIYLSSKSAKHQKITKGLKDGLNYDSLPTTSINESIPKNAFVLDDSDDDDVTIYDSTHRLIK